MIAGKPITAEQRVRIAAIIDHWFDTGYDRADVPGHARMVRWFGMGVTSEEE